MEIFYKGEEVKKDRVIEKLRIEMVDKVTPEWLKARASLSPVPNRPG